MTSGNGLAGQAGQKYASALLSSAPGGITANTPGMSERVQRITARHNEARVCIYCGATTAAGQSDAEGRPAHLGCQRNKPTTNQPIGATTP